MADYLDVDPVFPPAQKYALLTCVYDENDKSQFALKLRGAFETKEDAGRFCTKLNHMIAPSMQTPTYVVELGSWLRMPPPTPEEITHAGGEEVFQEEYLQTLMKGYRDNQEKKDIFFHQRKAWVQSNGLSESSLDATTSGTRAQLEAFEPVLSNEDDDRQLL